MKTKYNIGERCFKTKKECENHARRIVNELGCCVIKREHPQFNFFIDLINNHPKSEEKIGVGIDYFYIQPNPMIKKYYQTVIKRKDGSEEDFSWVYCCQFREKTDMENLTVAMRTAIRKEVIDYKRSQTKMICNICKTEDELCENYHVDHDIHTFKSLKEMFLRDYKGKLPTSFSVCEKYRLTIFHPDDEVFEKSWHLYHNARCSYQILCRRCNGGKNSKRI